MDTRKRPTRQLLQSIHQFFAIYFTIYADLCEGTGRKQIHIFLVAVIYIIKYVDIYFYKLSVYLYFGALVR